MEHVHSLLIVEGTTNSIKINREEIIGLFGVIRVTVERQYLKYIFIANYPVSMFPFQDTQTPTDIGISSIINFCGEK